MPQSVHPAFGMTMRERGLKAHDKEVPMPGHTGDVLECLGQSYPTAE